MTQIDAAVEARRGKRNRARQPWRGSRVLSTPVRLISGLIPGQKADTRPIARLERVLAVGRAFLTVSALTAIYLDPAQPARLAAVTYAVLAAYAVYSLFVLVYVHRTARLNVTHGQLLHGFDVLWTAGLTFVSEGPVSPSFCSFSSSYCPRRTGGALWGPS